MSAASSPNNHSGPDYLPEEFDIPDNYNVLQISEIHAFEEFNAHESAEYCREIGRQINEYVETYDVDEIHILGDTGTFNDVYNLLDELDPVAEVKLIAGDEDKKDANPDQGTGDEFTGFYTQIDSLEPFDVEVEYEIFDEGFETEIKGHTVQAAHHPTNTKREDCLNSPDKRPDNRIDSLFSVEKHTNQKTAETVVYEGGDNKDLEAVPSASTEGSDELCEDEIVESPPSLEGVDYAAYDHMHMPYNRLVGESVVSGLGGCRNNHQPSEKLPEASIQLASFEEDKIHTMHFDALEDEIFEHQLFDKSGEEPEMFDVKVPKENSWEGAYLAVQDRFRKGEIPREAFEFKEDMPGLWCQRKENPT